MSTVNHKTPHCCRGFMIFLYLNCTLKNYFFLYRLGHSFCAIVGFHENEVLSADGKRTDSLFRIAVIGWNHSAIQEYTKVFFLIDAVSGSFPDSAVVCDLTVLLFYPFEISVNLLLKISLTLLSPVSVRQVIEFVVGMKNVSNHVAGFQSHSAFCGFQSNGLDKIGKRASHMNPTAGNPEVFPFLSELVIDLITVRNNGTGEVLQKFSWMVSFSGSLPIVKDNWRCGAQASIAVNPHIGCFLQPLITPKCRMLSQKLQREIPHFCKRLQRSFYAGEMSLQTYFCF